MTFKELLEQLQQLTPEQLKQEVMFVKYGACSDYDWAGLAENEYSENSDRARLMTEPDGVWYVADDFSNGIIDGLTKEEMGGEEDAELIVPPDMPFFGIFESKDSLYL